MLTYQLYLSGLLQGIGFRPFVKKLADERKLVGSVLNTGTGVLITVNMKDRQAMDEFVHCLVSFIPKPGYIEKYHIVETEFVDYKDFVIHESDKSRYAMADILPDQAICNECKKELLDPSNRRYRHPFISCTVCGPRYSLMKELPYDRERITMDEFEMCERCKKEYFDSADRRCFAQTIACNDCGPVLKFKKNNASLKTMDKKELLCDKDWQYEKEDALAAAIKLLKEGKIIAIKDIGGYHLSCLPDNRESVLKLRSIKHREQKPFAVMMKNVDVISRYAYIDDQEEKLLNSRENPIVLLEKRDVYHSCVCDDNTTIGVMLPGNPLQVLLMEEFDELIMTSANPSGEMICYKDEDVFSWMNEEQEIAGVLYHDRRIVTPMDDSVVQINDNDSQMIRRARGYVPGFIKVSYKGGDNKSNLLLAGGDLKSCFGIYANDKVYLSQHFGDLEDLSSEKAYYDTYFHMESMLLIKPEKIVTDMHPLYLSKDILSKQVEGKSHEVQHHFAHIESVIAEHNLKLPVLGVSYDGTGYGLDGSVWGGELLLVDEDCVKRIGHISPVEMIGGDENAKNADITRDCYRYAANQEDCRINPLLKSALTNHMNTYRSTSMGRLFDAVCATIDIKHENTYEGACAIALESSAYKFLGMLNKSKELSLKYKDMKDKICVKIYEEDKIIADTITLVKEIDCAYQNGVDQKLLAYLFHDLIIDMTVAMIKDFVRNTDKKDIRIALSGGCFVNRILTKGIKRGLEREQIECYINQKVPPGDGGIALGQAYDAILRRN